MKQQKIKFDHRSLKLQIEYTKPMLQTAEHITKFNCNIYKGLQQAILWGLMWLHCSPHLVMQASNLQHCTNQAIAISYMIPFIEINAIETSQYHGMKITQ